MGKHEFTCDNCFEEGHEYGQKSLEIFSMEETKEDPKVVESLGLCEGCYDEIREMLIRKKKVKKSEETRFFETNEYHEHRTATLKKRAWDMMREAVDAQWRKDEFLKLPADRKRKIEATKDFFDEGDESDTDEEEGEGDEPPRKKHKSSVESE
jgi:hypothetical protein